MICSMVDGGSLLGRPAGLNLLVGLRGASAPIPRPAGARNGGTAGRGSGFLARLSRFHAGVEIP